MNTCENCKKSKKTRSFGRLYGEEKTKELNNALDNFEEIINQIEPHSGNAMALAAWFNAYRNDFQEAAYLSNEISNLDGLDLCLSAIYSITHPFFTVDFDFIDTVIKHARISMLKSRVVHGVFLGFR